MSEGNGMVGEEDFMECLEKIGGCGHIGAEAQTLVSICPACRETITKLVLLRDHYQHDKAWFIGKP